MDPFTAIVLTIIMLTVSAVVNAILWPFRKAKEAVAAHPRRAARMVLGSIAAGLLAYLLHAPYVIEVSFAGGIAGLVLGEMLA